MGINLKKLIYKLGCSTFTKENYITDGQYTCNYENLNKKINELSDFYENDDKTFEPISVFYFNNTVPDIILLIWLIVEKKNFLLVSSENIESFRQNNVHFYRNEISIAYENINDNLSSRKHFIKICKNENYQENPLKKSRGKLLLLTSGSADNPKIVQHEMGKVLLNSENFKNHLNLLPSDSILIPVPVYHMYGLGAAFLPSIISGCSIYLINKTNVIKYLSAESDFKPTISFLTPSLSKMLVRLNKCKNNYRLIISAGDKMDEQLFTEIEKQLGKTINLYGSTELGVIATSNINRNLFERKKGWLFPLNNVQLRFEDVEPNDKDLPVKEIVCNHAYGFEKYINSNGDMVSTPNFINNWFKTSDLCHINENHGISLIGRKNHSINRNGILVNFSEIESLIVKIDARIEHVIVVASTEETKRGKKMIACCYGKKLIQSDTETIRDKCLSELTRHLVPDEIKIIDPLPLLQNGKIDRIALQNLI